MTAQVRKRFGELLVEEDKINEEDLQRALGEQKKFGQKLGQVLSKMGLLSEETVAEVLSRQLGIPVTKLEESDLPGDLISLIPRNIARNCNVIPIERHYNWVRVAMTDPLDIAAMDEVAHLLRLEVLPSIATESEFNRALERYYGTRARAQETGEKFVPMRQDKSDPVYRQEDRAAASDEGDITEAIGEKFASLLSSDSEQLLGQPPQDMEKTVITDTETPAEETRAISEKVLGLISQALAAEATDIHVQTDSDGGHVRMRVNGRLRMMEALRGQAPSTLMSALKQAAGLEPLEGPGDGRFDFSQNVSVRVSTCSAVSGEKALLRLVDKRLSSNGLDELGMASDMSERLKKTLRQPGGLVLCTGPLGSGKTTTLYAMIHHLNAMDKAIVTIEDPVEYVIDHVVQTQANSVRGLSLPQCVWSALRQDPDVCAVGEIREHESASLALQAGAAGVTVLATFCWHDAVGALMRLIEMGVEPSLLASSVVCVMSQRLVRKICDGCKESYTPPRPVLESVNIHQTAALSRGNGCPACGNTGYRGRTAVFEFLFMDDELRALIAAGASRGDIEKAAYAGGMKTLRENGIAKALLGITTLEEALNRTKTTAQTAK